MNFGENSRVSTFLKGMVRKGYNEPDESKERGEPLGHSSGLSTNSHDRRRLKSPFHSSLHIHRQTERNSKNVLAVMMATTAQRRLDFECSCDSSAALASSTSSPSLLPSYCSFCWLASKRNVLNCLRLSTACNMRVTLACMYRPFFLLLHAQSASICASGASSKGKLQLEQGGGRYTFCLLEQQR